MPNRDVLRMDGWEVVDGIRAGSFSVDDVANALIERIQSRQDEIQAFSYFEPGHILSQARVLDATVERGPLFGLPVAVKDVISTRDMPTEYGSAEYAGHRPGVDAACVRALRAAGALFVGKTVTTEFAAGAVSGPTRNPLDTSRTPGGSSSGSAAAVADFQAAIGIGTQTAGSTIRPASFTGLFGWKPTWNAISREGVKMFSASCDTVGFLARSARDLQLLAGWFRVGGEAAVPDSVGGLKVGLCRTAMWSQADASAQQAVEHRASALSNAGAAVVDVDLPPEFERISDSHAAIMLSEGGSAFLDEYRAARRIDPHFSGLLERAERISAPERRSAYRNADRCRALLDEILEEYDFLLTPSAPGEAPLGLASTGDAVLNKMWTILHVPVVNVPGHVGPAGMPIGVSLVGRRHEDRGLLELAGRVGRLGS